MGWGRGQGGTGREEDMGWGKARRRGEEGIGREDMWGGGEEGGVQRYVKGGGNEEGEGGGRSGREEGEGRWKEEGRGEVSKIHQSSRFLLCKAWLLFGFGFENCSGNEKCT